MFIYINMSCEAFFIPNSATSMLILKIIPVCASHKTAWEGADNIAFVEQINGFTEELKAMAAKLSAASQMLDRQKANYIARQDSNITQVKKLIN